MAKFIKVDGSEIQVVPKNGKTFTGEELREYVGGWLEMIRLPSQEWLVLDEEGKLKGKPVNQRGTLLGRACGTNPCDQVVGDILICSVSEIE